MSSISFSAFSSVSPITATAQPTQANNKTVATAAPASDTVSLSPTAQATALQQQGFTVNEIASTLGLTTATIDSYLDIATATTSGGGAPSGRAVHSGAPPAAAHASSSTAASNTAASGKSTAAASENSKAKAAP
jgi:hypothetical protein